MPDQYPPLALERRRLPSTLLGMNFLLFSPGAQSSPTAPGLRRVGVLGDILRRDLAQPPCSVP